MNPERVTQTLACLIAFTCACGGPQRRRPTRGCVDPMRTPDTLNLALNQTAEVPPPCPDIGESNVSGPIRLTATGDGLRIEMEVADPSYHPGTLRLVSGARDVVVVFPNGESPGRPSIELAAEAGPAGSRAYHVDDVVPWENWRLHGPDGEFHFVCVIFDREASGAESETRISMHIRAHNGGQ